MIYDFINFSKSPKIGPNAWFTLLLTFLNRKWTHICRHPLRWIEVGLILADPMFQVVEVGFTFKLKIEFTIKLGLVLEASSTHMIMVGIVFTHQLTQMFMIILG